MNATDNTNLCCEIHEPEIVTVTMRIDQLHLLQTICDVIREDDDETRQHFADFAESLYREIDDEITYKDRTA